MVASIATELTVDVRNVAGHSEDDLVLATAVSGQAGYLVTGDRELRALEDFDGVSIVTPREFLTILEGPSTDAS